MATWQADFHFIPFENILPDNYQRRFGAVLPEGRSSSVDLEQWGTEESDRIDVCHYPGASLDMFCRIYKRLLCEVKGLVLA